MAYENEYERNSSAESPRPAASFFQAASSLGDETPPRPTPTVGAAPANTPPVYTETPPIYSAPNTPPVPPAPAAYKPPVPPAPTPGATKTAAPMPPVKPAKPTGSGNKLWLTILIAVLCAALVGGGTGALVSYLYLDNNSSADTSAQDDTDDDDKDKDDDKQDDTNQGENNQGENNQGENNQGENSQSSNNQSENNQSGSTAAPSGELTAAQVFEQNVNSTVTIHAGSGIGSGFIYSTKGDTAYIVTNHHVVEGGRSFTVVLYDGTELNATLLGSDKETDIAVLKVQKSGLKAVKLGDSDTVKIGHTVHAIGNPLGEFPFSMSSGIISGKDRMITMPAGNAMALFQTDCPINSGNSGGAVFNAKGEVIAIVDAKSSDSILTILGLTASVDNVGFVIPLNSVKPVIDNFIATDR